MTDEQNTTQDNIIKNVTAKDAVNEEITTASSTDYEQKVGELTIIAKQALADFLHGLYHSVQGAAVEISHAIGSSGARFIASYVAAAAATPAPGVTLQP